MSKLNINEIELYRYASSFYAEKHFKPNGVKFKINKIWLEKYLKIEYQTTIEKFLSTYTWDEGTCIYEIAKEKGMVKE